MKTEKRRQLRRGFSPDEQRQMLDDLRAVAEKAFANTDISIFRAAWKGWSHSLEVVSDPEAMTKLRAPVQRGLRPLPRPSAARSKR